MFRHLALPFALFASSALAPAVEPAAATGSIDDTRISSLSDLAGGSTQTGAGGLPTFGARAAGSGTKSGFSGGMLSAGGRMLRYYDFWIDPGTGFLEDFYIYEPVPRPASPKPLLVAFHGFGVTQKDIVINTTLMQECAKRGWYMLAPLSASGGHFMSDPGQVNTRAALDWTLATFNVDRTRIYGVGFSMGGGMALNFGARNLDPERGMFAAVVDHTGAVDLNETYRKDPPTQYIFDFWYGDGSPGSADPERMMRSSVIEFDDATQQVNPNTDLARNLSHLPIQMVRAQNDPLVLLSEQHDRFYSHMMSLGRSPGPAFSSLIIPSNVHKWSTLNTTQACDWLAQFTLQLPASANTLALKEGPHFYFYVDQEVTGALTPFSWSIDTAGNRLEVSQTKNLTGLIVDSLGAGLATGKTLYVNTSTADGLADRITLRGYDMAPAGVMRDGKIAQASEWTYNATAKTVVLKESDGSKLHSWLVAP